MIENILQLSTLTCAKVLVRAPLEVCKLCLQTSEMVLPKAYTVKHAISVKPSTKHVENAVVQEPDGLSDSDDDHDCGSDGPADGEDGDDEGRVAVC